MHPSIHPSVHTHSGPPNCPTRDAGRGLLGAALRFLKEKERALLHQLRTESQQQQQAQQQGAEGGRYDNKTNEKDEDGGGGGGGGGEGIVGLAMRALVSVWNGRW